MPEGIYSDSKKAKYQNKKNKDKVGMLSGGQAKLDKNKNNKIDAEDFALLRKEKKSKDPKVMKAKRGMLTDDFVKRRKKLMGIRAVGPAAGMMGSGVASQAQVKQGTKRLGGKGRVGTAAALGAVGVGVIAKEIKKRMDKRKAKKRDAAKVKKMGGGMMKKYSKGTDYQGVIRAAARDKAKVGEGKKFRANTFEDKGRLIPDTPRNRKRYNRMGGGMMQRPMGMAKKGKMMKARGGGMAKTKPTSMY